MSNREVRGPETGGGTPRAASQGDISTEAGAGLVLLLFSPAALIAAVATVYMVGRQNARHWWEFVLAGVGVLFGLGLVLQLVTGNVLWFHFGGWWEAIAGEASWFEALARTVPLGLALGFVAGAGELGLEERRSGGHEFHHAEIRRRSVNATKQNARVDALLKSGPAKAICKSPPLGVSRGGDLESWTDGAYVCLPPKQAPAMGVLGESGSGKTVTVERLVSLAARAGRKVIFADFKGTDPELPARVVAAYKQERRDALCGLWPAQRLDIWRGSPTDIANRLLEVKDYTEPYYYDVAETVIRLVMHAPDVAGQGPVRDSEAFMDRLDPNFLARAWDGHPRELANVEDLRRDPKALGGVRYRFSGFFSALAGRLDHGFSFEDADLAVLSVSALARPKDAQAIARMVLTDFGAYCVSRKPRVGEDVTFIFDEFSAVTDAATMVIKLAEQVRDVGGQIIVSAQSYEGLGGDDSERRRMLNALAPGGIILHRLSDPESVVEVAGTVRGLEFSSQLDGRGPTGLGTTKPVFRYKVDADAVRQATTGEAWALTHGRSLHMAVMQNPIDPEVLEHARRLVDFARMQAAEEMAANMAPTPRPWWEVRLPDLSELADARPDALEQPDPLRALPAGAPPPLELDPVADPRPPKAPMDPRLVLAILAYVRAGLIDAARETAERADGITDPARYVDNAVKRRAEQVEAAKQRLQGWRRSQEPPRGG